MNPKPPSLVRKILPAIFTFFAIGTGLACTIDVNNPLNLTYNFAEPASTNGAAPASITHTVTVGGAGGSFDIIATAMAGGVAANVGYFDSNGGLGVSSPLHPGPNDEGISAGETLILTFTNFTGCVASVTGGGTMILLDSIRFGRWNTDSGIITAGGATWTHRTASAPGTADVTHTAVYTFAGAAAHANAPASPFPSISPGVHLYNGAQVSFTGTYGNPRYDIENMTFSIIPEPSRALLLALGLAGALTRRCRF